MSQPRQAQTSKLPALWSPVASRGSQPCRKSQSLNLTSALLQLFATSFFSPTTCRHPHHKQLPRCPPRRSTSSAVWALAAASRRATSGLPTTLSPRPRTRAWSRLSRSLVYVLDLQCASCASRLPPAHYLIRLLARCHVPLEPSGRAPASSVSEALGRLDFGVLIRPRALRSLLGLYETNPYAGNKQSTKETL